MGCEASNIKKIIPIIIDDLSKNSPDPTINFHAREKSQKGRNLSDDLKNVSYEPLKNVLYEPLKNISEIGDKSPDKPKIKCSPKSSPEKINIPSQPVPQPSSIKKPTDNYEVWSQDNNVTYSKSDEKEICSELCFNRNSSTQSNKRLERYHQFVPKKSFFHALNFSDNKIKQSLSQNIAFSKVDKTHMVSRRHSHAVFSNKKFGFIQNPLERKKSIFSALNEIKIKRNDQNLKTLNANEKSVNGSSNICTGSSGQNNAKHSNDQSKSIDSNKCCIDSIDQNDSHYQDQYNKSEDLFQQKNIECQTVKQIRICLDEDDGQAQAKFSSDKMIDKCVKKDENSNIQNPNSYLTDKTSFSRDSDVDDLHQNYNLQKFRGIFMSDGSENENSQACQDSEDQHQQKGPKRQPQFKAYTENQKELIIKSYRNIRSSSFQNQTRPILDNDFTYNCIKRNSSDAKTGLKQFIKSKRRFLLKNFDGNYNFNNNSPKAKLRKTSDNTHNQVTNMIINSEIENKNKSLKELMNNKQQGLLSYKNSERAKEYKIRHLNKQNTINSFYDSVDYSQINSNCDKISKQNINNGSCLNNLLTNGYINNCSSLMNSSLNSSNGGIDLVPARKKNKKSQFIAIVNNNENEADKILDKDDNLISDNKDICKIDFKCLKQNSLRVVKTFKNSASDVNNNRPLKRRLTDKSSQIISKFKSQDSKKYYQQKPDLLERMPVNSLAEHYVLSKLSKKNIKRLSSESNKIADLTFEKLNNEESCNEKDNQCESDKGFASELSVFTKLESKDCEKSDQDDEDDSNGGVQTPTFTVKSSIRSFQSTPLGNNQIKLTYKIKKNEKNLG